MTKKIYLYMLLGSIAISTPTISFADSMSAYEAAKEIAYAKIMNKALQKINQTQKDIEREILKTATAKDAQGYQINLADNYVKYTLNSFLPTNYDKNYLNLVSSSTSLPPLAYDITRSKDNTITFKIPFSTQVIDFLKEVDELKSKNTISNTEPTDTTKLWYKPDGNGGFLVYKYNQSQKKWELILAKAVKSKLNQTNTTIVKSKEELDNLVANKGDIAYLNKDDNSIQKYIYDGSSWILQSEATNYKKVTECSADDIGVIKYISQNDCLSSCQKNSQNKYTWECIESKDDAKPCKTIYNSCYAILQNAKESKVAYFNGNSYLSLKSLAGIDTNHITISINAKSTDNVANLIWTGDNGGANVTGSLSLSKGNWVRNSWKVGLFSKNGQYQTIDLKLKNLNNENITITRDGSKVRIYVDGKLVGSVDNMSPSAPIHNDAVIGGNIVGGWGYTGIVSDCKIYNKALSEEEVKKIAKGEIVDKSSLIAHYDFKGTNPFSDKSGKRHDLINNGVIIKNMKLLRDGVYTIDPDGEGGEEPFKAYCDMTTDGGGWTRCLLQEFTNNNRTSYGLNINTKRVDSPLPPLSWVSKQCNLQRDTDYLIVGKRDNNIAFKLKGHYLANSFRNTNHAICTEGFDLNTNLPRKWLTIFGLDRYNGNSCLGGGTSARSFWAQSDGNNNHHLEYTFHGNDNFRRIGTINNNDNANKSFEIFWK